MYFFIISLILHLFLLLILALVSTTQVTVRKEQSNVLQTYLSQEHNKTIARVFTNKGTIKDNHKNMPILSRQTTQQHKVLTIPTKTNHEVTKILKLLHEAIALQQHYPPSAIELNQTGTVKIGFWLHPNGQLENIRVLKSSAIDSLDNAAIQAVEHIEPIKNLTAYLHETKFFSVDIVFEEAV